MVLKIVGQCAVQNNRYEGILTLILSQYALIFKLTNKQKRVLIPRLIDIWYILYLGYEFFPYPLKSFLITRNKHKIPSKK